MDNISLDKKIESLLFWKGEEMQIPAIAKTLEVTEKEVVEAVAALAHALEDRGIVLIQKDNRIMLRTHPEMSPLFEALTHEELTRDLSKAALETLTIILYRGPIKRSDIDFIRGVNSQFILRNLSVRGLIEKVVNPQDERGFLYRPSFELMAHLGITNISDLPEYQKVQDDIDSFMSSQPEEDTNSNT